MQGPAPSERLLAHLDALDRLTQERTPASERLAAEIGPELATKLASALGGRRARVGAAA